MAKENKTNGVSKSSDWFDAIIVNEKPTRLSGVVFILLSVVSMFAAIAYGAVDNWALIFLTILTGLIAIFWILDAWISKEFRFSANALQMPVLGLILIGVIQLLPLRSNTPPDGALGIPVSAALSLDPYLTRLAVILLIVYFVFFAAALVYINNQKRLRRIVLTIIIFSAAMAFFGILQRLANLESIYGLRPSPQAIPFASFVNQHHFAAFMEMTIGLTLGLLFGKATNKDKNLLLIIATILMGIAVVLTGSRGGFLSLLGVLGFVIAANFLQRRNEEKTSGAASNYRRNFALIGGGIALLLILFGSAVLLGGDESLLRGTGLQNTQADISNGRAHFWQIAGRIIVDNPVIGVGLNAFGNAFPHYDTWNGTYRIEQAHNDYLQILADAGIPGFLAIAAFIFLLFCQSLKIIGKASDRFRRSSAIGALAGCFGILLHSFFDFPLRTPSNAFFFLLLTVIATASISYPKLYKKEK
ncbi:MAG TPA: O-antigen ligase family protein [Pyrinomonadaceae bacterium]|jgi:O-antigen ligase